MVKTLVVIVLAVIFGAAAGALASYTVSSFDTSTNNLVRDFYLTENAVHVSPHHIRKAMDKGDDSFVLVDLRSQEEYEEEHIIWAVNIPAYKDRDNSDYGAIERIVISVLICRNIYCPNYMFF